MNEDIINNIVKKAKEGDQDSLAKLVELFQDDIFRYSLFLVKDFSLAQDLSQETLLKGIEKINSLKNNVKIRQWFFSITHNLFIDEFRKQKKIFNKNDLNFAQLGILDDEEAYVNLMQVLEELSDEDQSMILLADIEDYSYLEISQMLNKTESSVKSAIFRAREHFSSKFFDIRNFKGS